MVGGNQKIASDLKSAAALQSSLAKAYETLQSEASSFLLFSFQWKDLAEHLDSIREAVRTRFEDLERRESDLKRLEEAVTSAKAEEFRRIEESIKQGQCRLESLNSSIDRKSEEVREVERLVRENTKELEYRVDQVKVLANAFVRNEDELRVKKEELSAAERSIQECEARRESKVKEMESKESELEQWAVRLAVDEKKAKAKAREVASFDNKVKLRLKEAESKEAKVNERLKEVELEEEKVKQMLKEVESKEGNVKEAESKVKERMKEAESMEEKAKERMKKVESMEEKVKERMKEVETKEGNVDAAEKSIEEGKKNLDSMSKKLQEKEWKLRLQAKEMKVQKQEVNVTNAVESESERSPRDGKSLQLLMTEQLKRINLMGSKVLEIVQASTDPGKLVLEAMEGFYPHSNRDKETDDELQVIRRSCILLLEELKIMEIQISTPLKEEAKNLAAEWKAKMTENRLEILGYMQLVATYELTFDYDAEELQNLLAIIIGHPKQASGFCHALGTSDMPSGSSKSEESEPPLTKTAVKFSSSTHQPSAITSEKNSDGFLIEQMIWNHSIQSRIFFALQNSSESDPSKLVLDLMLTSLDEYWTKGDVSFEVDTMKSFISQLDDVPKFVPQIDPHVKDEAIKLAVQWKAKIIADAENSLEILGFLQFVAAYGLLSTFNIDEIATLIGLISRHAQTLEICQTLCLAAEIPGFIRNLIQRKQIVEAIRLICSFKLIDKFPLAPLLREYVKNTCSCNEICVTKTSLDEKDKVVDGQIANLRAVIECINEYKLESEYQPALIEMQIEKLNELKESWRGVAPSLASKVEQQGQHIGKKRTAGPSAPVLLPQQQFENKNQSNILASRSYTSSTFVPGYPQGSSPPLPHTNYGLPGQFNIASSNHQFAAGHQQPFMPPMKRPCMIDPRYAAPVQNLYYGVPHQHLPPHQHQHQHQHQHRLPHPNMTQFWR